jgi:hypothetical protein
VQGSTLGRLTVAIDGRELSSLRHEIAREVAWLPFGARRLAAGEHTLTLRYSRGPFWRAGRGTAAAQKPLGLVALAPEGLPEQVRVPVGKADTLCDGRSFDWVEALPG